MITAVREKQNAHGVIRVRSQNTFSGQKTARKCQTLKIKRNKLFDKSGGNKYQVRLPV